MKIFSKEQIHNADAYTIDNEPITSINLMERAAQACVDFLLKQIHKNQVILMFCGNGNNGGDGFAMARLLYEKGYDIKVFIDENNPHYSIDAAINLARLKTISGIDILDFQEVKSFNFSEQDIIIDALFGSGLNRIIEGEIRDLIEFLNQQKAYKIAIDLPSGLYADKNLEKESVVFQAYKTLSFQFWKKSFLHPETGQFCGDVHILDIQLSQDFIKSERTQNFIIDEKMVLEIFRSRKPFSHKGSFGKVCLVAGSFGKIGAAVLATKAALKSGCGLTFTLAPKCGYEILQSTCPEAMYLYGGENYIQNFEIEKGAIVGIGPGLGKDPETETCFLSFLESYEKPLVLDADALNLISKNKESLGQIPKNSIITPHPKEFERLFGKTSNSFERLELAKANAKELQIYIVLKDHHTQIVTPKGEVFYNITGNSGMAKGGSGDALTGVLTSLLAQQYSPEDAAIFGVWLHGKAGDFAAEKHSKEAMLPSDLIDELGNIFKILDNKKPY